MKISNQTPIVFNGYKNLIHTNMQSKDCEYTLLALQLNDDDGYKDLSAFRKLLRTGGEPETNVMTFVQVKNKKGYVRNVLNGALLLKAEELNLINDSEVLKKCSKNDLKKLEDFNIQASTFLASITKRLMQNELVSNDSGMKHTISEVVKILRNKLSMDYIMDILENAFMEKKHVYKSAEKINENIVNNMNKYFKV